MNFLQKFCCWSLAITAVPVCGSAFAQADYPAKPIRIIVTVPAGAGSDILARTLALKLTEQLGQQVLVDNRGGASGIIGMELAAKAASDGYTLVQGTVSTLSINPAMINPLPYDPVRDFAPISLMDDSVIVMVIHPSLPVASVKELIALAKARPGQINYGSAGTGSVQHLVAHMFRAAAGVDVVHVPYKGAAPAFVDLVAGQITLIFSGVISATPFIKSGKLRALAVTSAKRVEPVMDLPTLKEAGGPDIHASLWNGLLAPARTPPAIVERLHREIAAAVRAPDYISRIRSSGGTPVSNTPDDFAKLIKTDLARYAKAVKDSGARAE
jgi:tripartite-type tricarboxylate transporter receptor subunit TctC